MELKTIALFAAIFAGLMWLAALVFGIAMTAAENGPVTLLIAIPAAAIAYVFVRLVGERLRTRDPYEDIEE